MELLGCSRYSCILPRVESGIFCKLLQRYNNQFSLIMKKTLIAILVLSGVAAADVVFDLATAGTPTSASATVTNGIITPSASDWEHFDYAKYTLPNTIILSAPTDVLDFSFTVNRPHAIHGNDTVEKSLTTFSMALTGSNGAVIIGHGYNSDYTASAAQLQIGTYDTCGDFGYIFRESDKGNCKGVNTLTYIDGGLPFDTSTITGQIAWDNTEAAFVMTLTSSALLNGETLSYSLGNSVNVSDVVFSVNGVDTPKFTGAIVSCSVIPEPTTATLSLLILAGVAARRRRTTR